MAAFSNKPLVPFSFVCFDIHSRISARAHDKRIERKFVRLASTDRRRDNRKHVCECFFAPRSFQMFSEPPAASVPSVPSTSISPLSSEHVSPVSSASHSRTSTITSNSFHRHDPSSSSSAHLTGHSSQRQMKIGKYFLERTIGKGNFAVVKLATHCDTHQKVIDIDRGRDTVQANLSNARLSVCLRRWRLKLSTNPA